MPLLRRPDRPGQEHADDDFAALRAGDANVWLHAVDAPIDPSGVEHWIGVEDVDEAHRRLAAAGVADLRPPNDVPQWRLRVTGAPHSDGRRVYLSAPLTG